MRFYTPEAGGTALFSQFCRAVEVLIYLILTLIIKGQRLFYRVPTHFSSVKLGYVRNRVETRNKEKDDFFIEIQAVKVFDKLHPVSVGFRIFFTTILQRWP